ncbi:hypothetical protein [Sulfitobacter sp.]|uniref:hypothetical protein n=1 Tax=Sulfitobacter sp. TaxID=1903071 RepID=UPI003002816E
MAMTEAEKKRAQRARKKQEHDASLDSTYSYLKEPFFKWLERTDGGGDWTAAEAEMNLASIELPMFEDDRGPYPNDDAFGEDIDDCYTGYIGSIGRAEILVRSLVGAASCIASTINQYKQEEVKARLAELENPETADRATAIQEAVRLNKILDQLQKRVRMDLPSWKVTDI